MNALFGLLTGILGALAVGLGAFGAHALRSRLTPELMQTYQTAVLYHLVHSIALGLVALLVARTPTPMAQGAGWCFVGGMLLFSGSLYALTLTGVRSLGAITPLGGIAFMVGWLLLGIAAWRGGIV